MSCHKTRFLFFLFATTWVHGLLCMHVQFDDLSYEQRKTVRGYYETYLFSLIEWGRVFDVEVQLPQFREICGVHDINTIRADGETLLHRAAGYGRYQIVQFLMNSGAYVDVRDANRATPLFAAAAGGHLQIVRHFVLAGADIYAKDEMKRNAFCYACLRGHLDSVNFLFQQASLSHRPFDIDIQDIIGHTPLLLAASCGHLPVVRYLVHRGAGVNRESVSGKTALDSALDIRSYIVALYLVCHGALLTQKSARRLILAQRLAPRLVTRIIRNASGSVGNPE